jgi:hypothetical protein
MWVLFVVILGTYPSVQMHDFDGRTSCSHAAELLRNGSKGQVIAYCVERDRSALGPHDDIPAPAP